MDTNGTSLRRRAPISRHIWHAVPLENDRYRTIRLMLKLVPFVMDTQNHNRKHLEPVLLVTNAVRRSDGSCDAGGVPETGRQCPLGQLVHLQRIPNCNGRNSMKCRPAAGSMGIGSPKPQTAICRTTFVKTARDRQVAVFRKADSFVWNRRFSATRTVDGPARGSIAPSACVSARCGAGERPGGKRKVGVATWARG